jgi:methylaspartate ammonia-lyase
MRIENAVFVKGFTGFFFDDQRAIKGGAVHDGFDYLGAPKTEVTSGPPSRSSKSSRSRGRGSTRPFATA